MTDAAALGFNPADTGFIADPYPVFTRLREAGRAVYDADHDSWLLTRFADVHAALRNRALGRIFTHRFSPAEFGQDERGNGYQRWQDSERWSLLNLEPPDHTRLRRLVTAVFTPRAVAALRPQVEEFFAAALRDPLQRGEFDLIAEVAQPFSIAVICELLGVPQDAGPRLLDWSHAIVRMYELQTSPAERDQAETAAAEFIDYVRELIRQRRLAPTDDLITRLVQVADDGDRLSEDEIVCTVIVLLNAGHEATVNSLGNGMRAAMLHPGQWARVTTGAVPALTAVEEFIRWDAPLQLFERWVLDDVDLAGRTFRRGERLGMLFGVANRDPERFVDPDAFDIGRGDTGHIGFGGGTHFCIGAPLARLELDVAIGALAAGPALTLAAAPQYQPYFVIRGLQALVLQVQA